MILLLRIDKSLMNCCQKCCRIEQSLISLSIRRFILLRLAKFGTSIRQPVRTELLPHGQPDKFANHYPMPRHQTLNIHFITFWCKTSSMVHSVWILDHLLKFGSKMQKSLIQERELFFFFGNLNWIFLKPSARNEYNF